MPFALNSYLEWVDWSGCVSENGAELPVEKPCLPVFIYQSQCLDAAGCKTSPGGSTPLG